MRDYIGSFNDSMKCGSEEERRVRHNKISNYCFKITVAKFQVLVCVSPSTMRFMCGLIIYIFIIVRLWTRDSLLILLLCVRRLLLATLRPLLLRLPHNWLGQNDFVASLLLATVLPLEKLLWTRTAINTQRGTYVKFMQLYRLCESVTYVSKVSQS